MMADPLADVRRRLVQRIDKCKAELYEKKRAQTRIDKEIEHLRGRIEEAEAALDIVAKTVPKSRANAFEEAKKEAGL